MSDFKPGDQVKVTVEANVVDTQHGDLKIRPVGSVGYAYWVNPFISSVIVEKVGPPVVVFKAGDRLRSKYGYEVTLGKKGYLQHFTTGEVDYYDQSHNARYLTEDDEFTSKEYELVCTNTNGVETK